MINKKGECDIIADLLPLYMDHMTKEDTNRFIQNHLAECEECRAIYELMKDSFTDVFAKQEKKKKIRWYKKIRIRMFLYGYLLVLLMIWLYCILDLLYFW